jgi:hypothetical protein
MIFAAIEAHSDRVCDNSGSNQCGPDKCGRDKRRVIMISVMVSDNPGTNKDGSYKCGLTRSDNPGSDKSIPDLLSGEADLVQSTSASEPPRLNL